MTLATTIFAPLLEFLASQTADAAKESEAQKSVDVLICTEFQALFKTWATYFYAGRNPVVEQVSAWQELPRAIERFKHINELVLGFHGSPNGSVTIGDELFPLDHPDLIPLFKNTSNIAQSVEFLCCNIGRSPNRMAAFARLMGCRTIVGWTQFLTMDPFSISLTGINDAERIARSIGLYADYLPHNFPITKAGLETAIRRLGRRPRELPCVLEWFSYNPANATMSPFPKLIDDAASLEARIAFDEQFNKAKGRRNARSSAHEESLKNTDLPQPELPLELFEPKLAKITITIGAK